MKKLFLTMLTVLACGATYALPVGNPSDASLLCDGLIWEGHCGDPCDSCLTWCDAFSIRVGFYGDYVFNRHLEVNTNESHKQIEHTTLTTNAGIITANFWDTLDIFSTLGTTSFGLSTNATTFGSDLPGTIAPRLELESDTNFSWSVGTRGTIWECGCTTLGAEFQYFYTKVDIKRVTLGDLFSNYPNNVDAKHWEWQAGVGIAHRTNLFVYYAAIKYNRAKTNFDNANIILGTDSVTLLDLRNSKHVGYALGVSLIDCEKASLTIEGRFSDEKALHINGQIRF